MGKSKGGAKGEVSVKAASRAPGVLEIVGIYDNIRGAFLELHSVVHCVNTI